jgi:hypothetical protein
VGPVFESFHTVLGDRLYHRVHPDWRTDQAASVRGALAQNETWVAVTNGTVAGFVNVIFNPNERSAEIYMIAVDPTPPTAEASPPRSPTSRWTRCARGIDLAIVATGGDPGHAPARATYEKAGFTGAPQVWYSRLLNRTNAQL